MKEAGYEWDAEKKELKKIEQKSSEDEELTEFDKAVGISIGTWNPKTPEQVQSVKAVSKRLLKLAKKQINDEHNLAWSEEDERILNGLISSLARIGANTRTDSTSINYTFSREIDWLKSLKGRYTWKPSDEQMDVLLGEANAWTKGCPKQKILESLYNDLKKLRGE